MHPPTPPRSGDAGIVPRGNAAGREAIRVDWPRFWALTTRLSNGPAVEREDARGTVLCVLLGVPDGAGAWPSRTTCRYDR